MDLAFRSGEIADVSLVARSVGVLGRAVVAAPIWFCHVSRHLQRIARPVLLIILFA